VATVAKMQPNRVPTTFTSGGYAGAGRVVQGATAYTGGYTAGATTFASSPAVRTAAPTTFTSQGLAQARPVTTSGAVTMAGGFPTQARVISGGATATGITTMAAPTSYRAGAAFGTQRVISGATMAAAPRTVISGTTIQGARPATILSGGFVQQPYNQVGGPTATQAAYEVKHKDDPQLQNLKELRKNCGLKGVPVNDALQAFKATAVDGQLNRDQFREAQMALLTQFQIAAPSDEVINAVFDLFDRDDNGVVDMMELICGASLLCTGSEEDKIHAVFNVFDENGDGVISMDEMFKFLTSVFKVVLTPNVMAVMNSMGVTVESPEDLASVTALECFKTADLNHDGRLSVDEFKNWFFAPRNDPSFLFSPVRKLLQ